MDPFPPLAELRARHGIKLQFELDSSALGADLPVVELRPGDEFFAYLRRAEKQRHGRLLTWTHRLLRQFFSDFDVNAWLGTYPMFVLGQSQLLQLLGGRPGGHVLDVGAGRGDVSRELGALFDQHTVTETSQGMAQRLRKEGYQVLEGDITDHPPLLSYDAVALFNVLDRCDRPLSLLGRVRESLKPGGLLLLALVLPYQPFVYGDDGARSPRERLPLHGNRFEDLARQFCHQVLEPLGFEIQAVSRCPYLSGGDAHAGLYELDDLLVICKAGNPLPIVGSPEGRSVSA